MKVKIAVLDAILSRTNLHGIKILEPVLTYRTTIWKQGPFAKKKIEVLKKCYKSYGQKETLFLTGFLPKIQLYLESVGYELELINHHNVEIPIKNKYILIDKDMKAITFREDQIQLMEEAFKNKRGIIKSPTGSGKSILMLGITARFKKSSNILVLCHNAGIVRQLYADFTKYFKKVVMFGGDVDPGLKFEPLKQRIILSTIQSFSKIHPYNYCDYFDCVMVDEAHRVSSFTGLYADVLQNLLAPYRFGFTATLPTVVEAQFAYEGLIGPLIAELSINQAAELNILAKPKLKITKAGFPHNLRDIRDYHTVYEEGIVQNRTRNMQIVGIIRDCIDRNETVLVFVSKIAHGNNIEKLCFDEGINITFVQGSSDIETRERIRNELNKGSIKAVLSTTVWKEGINIPNLHNVINAAGGKSEISTLQAIGRGLRKTDEKSMVVIYDFFDPGHPYLIAHFGERLCLYMDMGWL
jgi:superfamily II DNA or RNA helicase